MSTHQYGFRLLHAVKRADDLCWYWRIKPQMPAMSTGSVSGKSKSPVGSTNAVGRAARNRRRKYISCALELDPNRISDVSYAVCICAGRKWPVYFITPHKVLVSEIPSTRLTDHADSTSLPFVACFIRAENVSERIQSFMDQPIGLGAPAWFRVPPACCVTSLALTAQSDVQCIFLLHCRLGAATATSWS